MPSAELFILDTRARRIIPAEQVTDDDRIEILASMIYDCKVRESEIDRMIQDLRMDAIHMAINRRKLQNELSDVKYQARQS